MWIFGVSKFSETEPLYNSETVCIASRDKVTNSPQTSTITGNRSVSKSGSCPCVLHEGTWWVEVYIYLFLTSALDKAECHFHNSPPFFQVPIQEGARWALDWSGRFGLEKNLLPLRAIEQRFLCRPDRSVVTIPTTLTLLLQWRSKAKGSQGDNYEINVWDMKPCSTEEVYWYFIGSCFFHSDVGSRNLLQPRFTSTR